ncbi:MAG TPA: 4-hydroxybenzoyl-CoA reductase [Deltaproteobacteria bacterium]|nr:4-hydroxybenzoyl-CoA reductase [Deltaproteobacteria bacterium]
MLRLPPFEFLAPQSVAEAVALKAEHGADAMFVAGGTDLYPNMKRRQFEPPKLIGLSALQELHTLEFDEGLTLGAGISLSKIASHPELQKRYPALAAAAALVSSPQLRSMGTIGGNLCVDTRCTYYDQSFAWRKALGFCMKKDGDICWVARSSPKCLAVSSSDCAPVAIVLDAEFRLVGPEGERTVPASAFYQNDGMAYLQKREDELLVSLKLPPRDGWRMSYQKLRRRGSIDFPILGVATALRLAEDGTCAEARIVLGAVASCPLRAEGAEAALVGAAITPERIQQAAQLAAKLAKPMDNTDMSLGYRKKVTASFVAKALQAALE